MDYVHVPIAENVAHLVAIFRARLAEAEKERDAAATLADSLRRRVERLEQTA